MVLLTSVVVSNFYYHGTTVLDFRARDEAARDELRLLARIIRSSEFSGKQDWGETLISKYEDARDPTFRNADFIRENYAFLASGFVDKEIPVILPSKRRKGGFVVYSSGTVAWQTRQAMDEFFQANAETQNE